MATDRISIALSTCNGARVLDAQPRGLAAQTRPPAEVVAWCRRHGSDAMGVCHGGIRKKIRYRVMNRAADDRPMSEAAGSFARFIAQRIAAGQQNGPFGDRAILTAYRRLAEVYRLRAMLYSARSVSAREGIYARMRSAGAYGDDGRWTVPMKHQLRDIVRGTLFQGLLQTTPDVPRR